jgi:hypothetical protein
MRTSWPLLLTLALAWPAHAQEEEEAPPAEEPAAEAAPAEEAATEEAPAEEAPTEEAAAEETEPWQLYAGLDLVSSTLSSSGLKGFGRNEFDSGMYRLRVGKRVFESVGAELHLGFDNGGEGPGEAATDSYYGLFLVPTATVFETVELAFPVGYAMSSVARTGASEDLSSIGYGVDAELPLRVFAETMPDLRFTAGWMIYYQKSDARLYGLNAGLRYDFTTANLGNPFGWIGGIDLWPFGDDEETPAE